MTEIGDRLDKRHEWAIDKALRAGAAAEIRNRLEQVRNFIPQGGRVALFSLLGRRESHRIALLFDTPPAPRRGMMLIHNHLTGGLFTTDAKQMQLKSWTIRHQGFAYQEETIHNLEQSNWSTPMAAPLLQVYYGDTLRIIRDGPALDEPWFIPTGDKHRAISGHVFNLIELHRALGLCNPTTFNRNVTEVIPPSPPYLH